VANDNSGSVMVAFVLGALTGAAVALLFAPASGEETREYLGEKAREGKARVREGREHLIAAVERGREAFERERGDQV
jgi:gas vesicle protein